MSINNYLYFCKDFYRIDTKVDEVEHIMLYFTVSRRLKKKNGDGLANDFQSVNHEITGTVFW
jgi:hypothetical protein